MPRCPPGALPFAGVPHLTPLILSLNTIAHHIKHADSPAPALNPALANSYGALDLSNDEAQHPSQVHIVPGPLGSSYGHLTPDT